MKKQLKVSKIQWYGTEVVDGKAIEPPLSPSAEKHLEGLNYGEIFICMADEDPTLFIRTNKDKIAAFSKKANIEELRKIFLSKDCNDETFYKLTVKGGIDTGRDEKGLITGEITEDGTLKYMAGIFREYISSPVFIPGFLGEGAKLYKDDSGNWNFECDNMTIRKAFNVFEAIINRVRSINGAIVISQANGKIIEVIDNDRYWKIKFEGDYQTVQPHDLLRCQVFGKGKYYWVEVDSVDGNYANILKTEFADSLPEVGDEVVQMGNTVNPARQSLIYLSAEEGTSSEEAILGDFEPLPEESVTDKVVQKDYIVGKDDAIISNNIIFTITPEGEPDYNIVKSEIQSQSDIYAAPVTLHSSSAIDGILNFYAIAGFVNQIYLCYNQQLNLAAGEVNNNICISYNLTDFIPISNDTMGITDNFPSIDVRSFVYDNESGKYIYTLTGTYTGSQGAYVNYIIETENFVHFEIKEKWDASGYNSYDKFISVTNSTDLFHRKETAYAYHLYYKGKEVVCNNDFALSKLLSIYKVEDNKFLIITGDFVLTLELTEEELTYNGKLEKLTYELPNDYQTSNIGGTFFVNDKVYFNDLKGYYNIYDLKTGVISAPLWIDPNSAQHNFQGVLQFKSGVLFHDYQYKPDYWLPISYEQPNGKPKISILEGVNSKSLAGKSKGVLGYIGDITDANFPSDNQPSGYGAYLPNIFASGVLVLSSGKTVESEVGDIREEINTVVEAIPGKVEIEVSKEIDKIQIGARNLLKDSKELNINKSALTYKTFIPTVIIKPSTSYVFSVNRSISSQPGFTVMVAGINGEGVYNSFDIDISSKRQVVKFTTPESMATSVVRIYNAKTSTGNGADLTLYEFKLEEGTIATDWTPAPEDLEGIAKTYTDAQIKIVNDNISSKVSQKDFDSLGNVVSEQGTAIEQSQREMNLVAKASGNAQTIALAMSQGKMLHRDPTFKEGNNGISVYNNNSNGTVGIYRESASGNPNDSGIGLKIVSQGNASPGSGGFTFTTFTRANAVFVTRFIANIPVGYNVEWASNAIGDWGHNKWLTSQEGTGNWQEYASIVRCGSTGTFSSTNYFYITNGGAVTWYLAYASVFDATGVNDFQTKDEIKAGITITPNNVNVFGKDISLQGKVTIGSLDGTIIEGGKIKTSLINAHQIVVDGLNAGRITTGNLNVTNGAKIGDWTIEGGSIVARNTSSAKILVEPSGTRFLRINDSSNLMDIRADGVTGISIYTSDLYGKCLSLTAQTNGTAIESRGNHRFYARPGESISFSGQVNMSGLCLNATEMTSGQIGSDTVFVQAMDTSYDPTFTLPSSPPNGRTVIISTRNNLIHINGGSKYIRYNGALRSEVDVGGEDRLMMFVFVAGYWRFSYLNNKY